MREYDPTGTGHPLLKCGASADCDCFSVTSTKRLIFRRGHVDRIMGTTGGFDYLVRADMPEISRALSKETERRTHREATCRTLWTYGRLTGREDICEYINDLRLLADLQPYTEA